MIFTNDIYRFIGNALLIDGYTDITEVPASIIEKKINEFLRMKLDESDESLDNNTLLRRLESFLIGQHNKEQMMAFFIFYLLWYISIIQGFEVIWRIDDVAVPYLKDSELYPGKMDSLVTNKDIDYIESFNIVLEKARMIANNESRGK